ncbi:Hypothetical protein I595_2891 [Croceitalea dokdonensis DOKDO 023]|uniref:Uncharacterized protein n=1 Tax=Croceitalea dokdonensis DOKDO 023 TaxID=1300341 RepID=A0A0P7AST2_9FLAO|nr:hypothetical protein [Croceitalea dokdonensis]KPM30913.1 Hypothetical protein I595_2891 [Croceitalea dokdonensis DOKDO 023]
MALYSAFKNDLNNEQRLMPLLDTYYKTYLNQYTFVRSTSSKEQFSGIDLILTRKKSNAVFYVDEKAQLDYINEDLPTFAFELSYIKHGLLKKGWFLDSYKKTHFYALVTGIYAENNEYTSCKITMVNRKKLLTKIHTLQLPQETLIDRRDRYAHGRTELPQLHPKNEGYLFFSKNNKAEQPLNLILKLDWLIREGIAKRLV